MASLPYESSLPPVHAREMLRAGGGGRAAVIRLSRGGRVAYGVREFPHDCLLRLLEYPELPFRTSTRDTVKADRSVLLVRAELPIDGRMVPVAYKRVRRRNWLKRLTEFLRGNRTLRVWQLARRFEEFGIATARPLAVIVPSWDSWRRDSYLVTSWIEDSCNLHLLLERTPVSDHSGGRAKAAARSVGALLGRMHAAGISHRDLKASNLVVGRDDLAEAAYVIDLDGAAVQWHVFRSRRVRDLARLVLDIDLFPSVTRTQRLRFLRAYRAASGERHPDWKRAWRRLASAAAKLHARKQRRARR